MVKKILIDDEVIFEQKRPNRGRGNRPYPENTEKFPKFQEENFRKHVKHHSPRIVETKLFTNREKLVEYVNEKGQSDALIDIYKIEEGLYKLVVKR